MKVWIGSHCKCSFQFSYDNIDKSFECLYECMLANCALMLILCHGYYTIAMNFNIN